MSPNVRLTLTLNLRIEGILVCAREFETKPELEEALVRIEALGQNPEGVSVEDFREALYK